MTFAEGDTFAVLSQSTKCTAASPNIHSLSFSTKDLHVSEKECNFEVSGDFEHMNQVGNVSINCLQ